MDAELSKKVQVPYISRISPNTF